jgi:hypothetical protein
MKITDDKPAGRTAARSQYHEVFAQLTPEKNCLKFDTFKEMSRVAQSLEDWAHKYVDKGCKVITTRAHPKDGLPRCWLIWPTAPKTALRGPFPARVA